MVREATRSEISPAVAMRLTRVHEDAVKDVAKVKVRRDPAANLLVPKVGEVAATETIIHLLKSKPRWCPHHMKGNCSKM